MSKKTLVVLGASLFFAACTHSSMVKNEVAPTPAPVSSSVMSAPAVPVVATGTMMQSSSVMSAPAAMENAAK